MLKKLLVVLCLAFPLLAQTEAPPIDPWTSSAGAGVAITSGNSDTTNINIALSTLWDPKTTRLFKADALYLLGESNGEKQVDKTSAAARYEQLFDDRAFWFGELQYLRDPLKDISYLISPLAGAGYHVIRTDVRKLTFDGALGAVVENNESLGSRT